MHKVGIDFDDVVADFNRALFPFMNRKLGTTVSYEKIHSFHLPDVYGIPQEHALELVLDFCHSASHDQIEPVVGAFCGLKILESEYELHLITSRCQSLLDTTHTWLTAFDLDIFTGLSFHQ